MPTAGEGATSTQEVSTPTEVPGEGVEDGQRFEDSIAHVSDGGEALEDGGVAGGEALEEGGVAGGEALDGMGNGAGEALEDMGSGAGEVLEDGGVDAGGALEHGGEALDVNIDMITGVVEAAAEVSVATGISQVKIVHCKDTTLCSV